MSDTPAELPDAAGSPAVSLTPDLQMIDTVLASEPPARLTVDVDMISIVEKGLEPPSPPPPPADTERRDT